MAKIMRWSSSNASAKSVELLLCRIYHGIATSWLKGKVLGLQRSALELTSQLPSSQGGEAAVGDTEYQRLVES